MPKLSIVVPFYGVEAYLAECLDSLRQQMFTDFEVVLVDDGSPDGSRAIAERYVALDPRFRLIVQENQGLGPARNTGTAHAAGEYLTFVDSDDLVAPRAYSQLVDMLDSTGSAFAAANARRFDASGSRPSWTHREAFATTRLATNIRELPVLMMDRMVWNKVYRRSFWDAGGYEFPPIRYEDYPVTLKAHLDAEAVDLHSTPIYFWRDRESGDSITQQVFKPGNARDRVTSAHMVLDLIETHAAVPAEVADRVRSVFVDVDLVALAGALAQAPAEAQPQLETLALELAARIPPQPVGRVTRFAASIHRGLLRGDLGFARAAAAWRETRNPRPLARHLARTPGSAPLAAGALRSLRLPDPVAARPLRCELAGSEVVSGSLVLTVDVALRAALAGRVRCRAELVSRAGRYRLVLSRRPAASGMQVEITVPSVAIAAMAGQPSTVQIELSLAALRWRGRIRLAPGSVPPLWPVPDTPGVQAAAHGDKRYLWFHFVAPGVPVVRAVTATAEGFVLEVNRSAGEVVVSRPDPTADLVVPVGADGRATLPLADLLADPLDDPVSGVQARLLTHRTTPGTEVPLQTEVFGGTPAGDLLVAPDLTGTAAIVRLPAETGVPRLSDEPGLGYPPAL